MEGQMKCSNCGQPRTADDKFCSNCGKPFEEITPPSMPAIEPSPGFESAKMTEEPKSIPWEQRDKYGFFNALWETWKESMFSPNQFFAKLPAKGGMASPLLYAVILGWIGAAFNQIYGLFISSFWMKILSRFMDSEEMAMGFGLHGVIAVFAIFLAPIGIIIGLFIITGIYHLLLLIFGWAKNDFEATFRAVAYSEGASIIYLIPFCGDIAVSIWFMVLASIGIKHIQKTTGGQSALIVLLPIILLMCCVIALLLTFGAAIWGLISTASKGLSY